MKKNLLRNFLLVFFVMCFVSCEKEVEVLPKIGALESQTIDSIKAFLNENSALYVGVKRNNFENLMLSLDWERASYAIEPDGMSIVKVNSVMEVPINRIGKKSTRQLVISMNRQEVQDAYVLDIIAAEPLQRSATSNVRSNADNNRVHKDGFSGEKITYDLGLRMQERLYYKNGELTQRDVLKEESKGGVGIQGGDSQVQQCTAWYLYTTYYYSDGSYYTTREYLGTTCEGGYECMPYVIGDDGAAIGVNCGGGGGGGGGDEGNYVSPADAFEASINDLQLDPCMKSILSDLKNLKQGVGQIVVKFAGNTPGYNWEVKSGSLSGATAYTNPPAFYNSTTGTINTVFDNKAWPNATELSWARTMLHESVHAYLTAYFATNRPGWVADYPQMVQEWDKLQNWNDVHHEEFARSIVSNIAIALKEYGISRGYNLDQQFYNDMSWAGLHGTSAFAKLSATDRSRILDVIAIELTGKDTSGNLKAPKGKTAGCQP